MNPAMVMLAFEGILKLMELVDRLVQAQGLKAEELETYIAQRNAYRRRLIATIAELSETEDVETPPGAEDVESAETGNPNP